MKSFDSTASLRRALAGHLTRLGVLAAVVAAGWAFGEHYAFKPAHVAAPGEGEFRMPVPPPPRQAVSASAHDEAVAAFSMRPLREPPPPPPPVVVAPQPVVPPKRVQPPEIELVATIVNAGQNPRAFVRAKSGPGAGRLVTVQLGREINGARVSAISEGALTLEFQGQEFVIRVEKKSS